MRPVQDTFTFQRRDERTPFSPDLRAVQELLGHVSQLTTSIFTNVSDESVHSAASAAGRARPRVEDAGLVLCDMGTAMRRREITAHHEAGHAVAHAR